MFGTLRFRRQKRHSFKTVKVNSVSQERKLWAAMEPLEERLVMSAGLSFASLSDFGVQPLHGGVIESPHIVGEQVTATVIPTIVVQSAATNITSANSALFTVNSAGTFTVTTGTTPATTLTETGALPAGVTFVDNGNGTATVAGTASATGTFNLTITAKLSGVTTDTQSFTLTVGSVPAFTTSNSETFQAGSIGDFIIHASGFPGATIAQSGTLPSGVSFHSGTNGTAVLTGTPAAGSGETYTLTFTASNGVTPNATQIFSLTVLEAPTITSAASTQMIVGSAATFSVTTTGYPTAAFTATGALPSGVTFVDNGDGTASVEGTPVSGSQGTYTISLDAGNGVGSDAIQTFTLSVGIPPAITSGTASTFNVGAAGTFSVATTGFPTGTLSETGALPSGVTFVDNGNGTATLAGTPAAGTGETYTLTITANNGFAPNANQVFTLTVDDVPAISSGAAATFSVGAPGTFDLTDSGFPIPTLSEIGALPSGVSFNTTSGILSGTPGAGTGGTYVLTFGAANGQGTAASQTFTLTVNQAPAITSSNAGTFTVGTAGTFSATATGFPVPTWTETGALPSGVTFNNATGVLSGTPSALTGQTYVLTFAATNGVGSPAMQTFTLTVNQAPAITSASTATFRAGTVGTFNVIATGFPVVTFSEVGTLPSGLSFNTTTGALTGTPGAVTGGTYQLTITASNGVGTAASQSLLLTVNQAPAITSSNSQTVSAGASGLFIVHTTGYPVAAISETGALPSGMTFVDKGNGTAQLGGTPSLASAGIYTLTINATNAGGSATPQTFTLTVVGAPTITSGSSVNVPVGTAETFTVTTTGNPTASITETGSLPSGMTFVDNGDGTATIAGTPAGGSQGVYTLSLDAGNFIGSDALQTFTLTVGIAPTISSANNATFGTGAASTFTVTTTGTPSAVALTETGALPSGVSFVDNGNGTATLAGTPAATSGQSYVITIGGANGFSPAVNQVFTLTVHQSPTVTSPSFVTFIAGTPSTFTVSTSSFPLNAALSETGALPTGVTFTDNGNGTATIAGTPGATTGGVYVLSLTANNGITPNGTQTLTLTVDQSPAINSATSTAFTVGAASTFSVTTTGFPTDGTFTQTGTLPTGVTFVDNGNGTATLAGTPAAGTAQTYVLTLTADNSVDPAATQTFTLTVNQVPAITSSSAVTLFTGTAGSFTVTTTGFPNAALTKTGALPSGVTFVDNGNGTATLSGTPGATAGGVFVLTLTANNGVTPNATQTFTITVDQAPAITSGSSATFVTGAASTFSVTSTGYPALTLTESGSLPGGVTFVDNGNGTATLAGTASATAGGTYAFTITAADGVSPNATQTFTLTVNQAPAITSVNHATFNTGAAGTFDVVTTGFPAVVYSETGALPSGVTLNNATGVLSGTPSATSGQVYMLTITANNGIGTAASQVFTLTVDQAAVITSANTTTMGIGAPSTFSVTTTSFPVNPALTETGALPTGVTFVDNGNGTATLAGTPGAGTGGSYEFTITANNGVSTNGTEVFTLDINQAPAITSANTEAFTAGSGNLFVIDTSGFPVAAITESGVLPSGLTFHDNGNGTATISGTPAATAGGAYNLTLTATNGVTPAASQVLAFTVYQAPAYTTGNSTSFTNGSLGTFTVTTTGYPTTALTESGTLPTGVTFVDNGNGSAALSGTPTVNGVYVLTFGATNILSTTNQTFTLTVGQNPAITSADHVTFATGTLETFSVTTTGFPSAAITETGALPSGIVFTPSSGSATFTGTPGATAGGTYVITLTAKNGGVDANQTFTLTVNQAPVITSASSAIITDGTLGSFTVTTTGYPTAAITESGALPAGVTFLDNGNGSATIGGTPSVGGTFTMTLTATSAAGTVNQTFTLSSDQAPAITSASGATFVTGTAGTFTVLANGIPAVSLSETGTLPTGVTFNNATGVLSGTAAAGTGGTYTLTFGATNAVSPDASQAFTLTVNQAPVITSASSGIIPDGTLGSFTVTTTGYPKAAITESGTLPAGVTLLDNGNGSATIGGTPSVGGTFTVTLTATSAAGTVNQTFTLSSDQAPAISSASSTTFTTGTAGTFTVLANGIPAVSLSETGTLPTGVTFNNATGVLSGTAAAGTGGTYTLTFGATNAVSPDASQVFTLTVHDAAAITSGSSATFYPAGTPGPELFTTQDDFGQWVNNSGGVATASQASPDLDGIDVNGLGNTSAAGEGATVGAGSMSVDFETGSYDYLFGPDDHANTAFMNALGTSGTVEFDYTVPANLGGSYFELGVIMNYPGNFAQFFPSGSPVSDGNGVFTQSVSYTVNAASSYSYFQLGFIINSNYDSNAATTFTIDNVRLQNQPAGNFAVTTTGFPEATVSESGALPSGVTFDNSTGVLSGTPDGAGGVYDLTFTASNGVGSSSVQDFVLNVDQAPNITSADSHHFVLGSAGTFTVTASGNPGATFSESGLLPNGVTFNKNTGVLAGTPNNGPISLFTTEADFGGSSLSGDDSQVGSQPWGNFGGQGSSSNNVSSAGEALTYTQSTDASTTNGLGDMEDDNLQGTFNSYAGLTSPSGGVTINSYGGGYDRVTSADLAPSVGSDVSLIQAVSDATMIAVDFTSPAGGATLDSGFHSYFLIGMNIYAAAPGLPSALDNYSPGNANPNGGFTAENPDPGTFGDDAGSYVVNHGSYFTAYFPFSYAVSGQTTPDASQFTSFRVGVYVNSGPNSTGGTNFYAPGGDADGNVTIDNIRIISSVPHTYPIIFTADNGVGAASTQDFSLSVDVAPAITSLNSDTFTVGTAGTFNVLASGSPAPTFSESGALPAGLNFNNTTGALTGTPGAGTGGTYVLTVSANNGVGAASTQTFTLTVKQAPAISSAASATFNSGLSTTFTITTTGYPNAALSKTGTLPAGVSFHNNGDGTATLTTGTTAVAKGVYNLTLTANNGTSPNATQTFQLTVRATTAAKITSAAATTFTTGAAGTFTVLTPTTTYPVAAITESGTLPTGVTLVDNGNGTASLAGTPGATTGGTYKVTISATNGVGAIAKQVFTLTVKQAPAITSADGDTFTAGTAGTFTITATGYPHATLTSVGKLPAGVVFHGYANNTGVLIGKPAASSVGTYQLTLKASNAVGTAVTQAFTLTVVGASHLGGSNPGVAGSAPVIENLPNGGYEVLYQTDSGTIEFEILNPGAEPIVTFIPNT